MSLCNKKEGKMIIYSNLNVIKRMDIENAKGGTQTDTLTLNNPCKINMSQLWPWL